MSEHILTQCWAPSANEPFLTRLPPAGIASLLLSAEPTGNRDSLLVCIWMWAEKGGHFMDGQFATGVFYKWSEWDENHFFNLIKSWIEPFTFLQMIQKGKIKQRERNWSPVVQMVVMSLIESTEFHRIFTVQFNRLWVRTQHLHFFSPSSFLLLLFLFLFFEVKILYMLCLCVHLHDFFN